MYVRGRIVFFGCDAKIEEYNIKIGMPRAWGTIYFF